MKLIKLLFLICCVSISTLFAQVSSDNKTKGEIFPTTETNKKDDSANTEFTTADNKTKSQIVVQEIDKSMIPIVQNRKSDGNYKIGFQDVLTITVYRHPELSQTVSVEQDGTILLPRINRPILAVCKTERELANLVTALYKNYLRNPYVNIRTQEQRSQPFAVIGAVNKPGNFYLKERVRLLRLLSLAGGQDVEKAGYRVQVARIGNASGCNATDDSDADVKFSEYSLNDVLSGKANPWMKPGDIVSVLEAQEAYVIGDVFEPAKISLKEPITLSEAIAKAGGVGSTAKISQVIIQRKEKNSTVRNEMLFSLKDIRENKIPDPVLQGNDIVVVNSSTSKKIKKGVWEILKLGIPNALFRIPI